MNSNILIDLLAFQRGYINLLVDDVAEDKMCVQPPGILNHPAWTLGHSAWASDMCIKTLGGTPKLDAAWAQRFSRESTPTSDRASYPDKAELLRVLDGQRAEVVRLLKETSAEYFAKPMGDPKMAARFPTIGTLLTFVVTTHEGTHLGQVATWRHAMGMVPALSKMKF